MSSLLVGTIKKLQTGMDSTSKLVLIILADYANDEGLAWPSVTTLTQEVEKSERTIQRSIQKLLAAGFIKVAEDQTPTLRYKNGYRPIVYQILPDTSMLTSGMAPLKKVSGVPLVTGRGDTGDRSEVSSVTRRGDTSDTQTIIKPSIKPSRESTRAKTKKSNSHPNRPVNANSDDSTQVDVEAFDARLQAWTPDADSEALAISVDADVACEAVKFKDHVLAGGYQPANLDAAFRKFLRIGAQYGYLAARKDDQKRPERHVHQRRAHEHSLGCEHVLAIMSPYEDFYDHERNGFEPSQWMEALQHAANQLNGGLSASEITSQLPFANAA